MVCSNAKIKLPLKMCQYHLAMRHNSLLGKQQRHRGISVFLPSCSKSISSPFRRSTLESQYSDVFSCSEAAGPCSIPPRQRPAANATDRSKSSDHAHMHSSPHCCCCCPEPVFSSLLSAAKKNHCHCMTSQHFLWMDVCKHSR